MTFARLFAAVAALGTIVVGFASPASADQVMEGVYGYEQPGGPVAEWTIFPICVPTVGDLRDNLELPVACTLHVSPRPTTELIGGDAHLTGGLWTYSNNRKDALVCPDGSTAPLQESYEFDDVAMTGTRSVANGAACGGTVAPKLVKYSFALAYRGPLSVPVDRYPLYCDPGGLKRCR